MREQDFAEDTRDHKHQDSVRRDRLRRNTTRSHYIMRDRQRSEGADLFPSQCHALNRDSIQVKVQQVVYK